LAGCAPKKLRAGLSSGPSGDEVYTPSPRRSEGQCGQLGGTLFAPHCEQNLYANPKRTAKSFRSIYQIHHLRNLFKNFLERFLRAGTSTGDKRGYGVKVDFGRLRFYRNQVNPVPQLALGK
jgi:hypothetical protein